MSGGSCAFLDRMLVTLHNNHYRCRIHLDKEFLFGEFRKKGHRKKGHRKKGHKKKRHRKKGVHSFWKREKNTTMISV